MIKRRRLAAGAVFTIGLTWTASGLAQVGAAPRTGTPPARFSAAVSSDLSEAKSLSQAFQAASEAILPSVVKVKTTANGQEMVMTFFGVPVETPKQEGLGSGVIIDSAGVVLTNNHVVKDADEILIVLTDGTELYATEVATDPLTDLAIVRVRPRDPLPAARFGDSDALKIGDWVLAVGHPLELETSVSAGIISAKGRSLERIPRAQFLQTDAAINPGNSGGPLVNLRGEIVGLNTAIASQTGGYQGIGFAVPGNLANDVQRQLRENGEVRRGYLGVSIQEVSRELAEKLLNRAAAAGVLITQVREGTPAASAGLRPGDVITQFAGQPVDSPAALQRAVERVPVGSPQRLQLVRFGAPMTMTVSTLDFGGQTLSPEMRGQSRTLTVRTRNTSSLGLEVGDLQDLARRRGVATDVEAVVVTQVDSDGLAANERVRRGMIILQVNDQEVRTVREFNAALRNESLSKGVLILVHDPQTEGSRFVLFKN